MSIRKYAAVTLVVFAALTLGACGTTKVRQADAGEDPQVPVDEARAEVRKMADDALQELYRRQPAARQVVAGAAGHAVFSNFGMKLFLTGAGSGEGVVVYHDTGAESFMKMVELQAGLGFGVKRFRQVWVFQHRAALESFVNRGYQFGGQATLAATAGGKGAAVAGAITVSPGVWLYQITEHGLAAEATVKGARYYRDKRLN